MAREVNRLTARQVTTLTPPPGKAARFADGNRLYLAVGKHGQRRWVFLYWWNKRLVEMGLGSVRDVPLTTARTKAKAANALLDAGISPLAAKRLAPEAVPTFGDFADDWFKAVEPTLTAEKNKQNYKRYLNVYMAPLRPKLVNAITTEDVLSAFKGLWATNYVSAKRARSTLERILDAAKVKGFRTGDNPAQWDGHLEHLLPPREHKTKHRDAVPYPDMPDFMAKLRAADGVSARGLEFAILTAARTGEVIGDRTHDVLPMPWSEVDLKARMWVIPGARMKEDRDHQVPLTPRAIEILEAMHALRWNDDPTCPVFPGATDGDGLNSNALLTTLKKLGRKETVHGFRSSIRDWAGNETNFARETLEEVLSHLVGNEVERSYRRGAAIAKRRALLEAWSDYLAGAPGKVVQFPVASA